MNAKKTYKYAVYGGPHHGDIITAPYEYKRLLLDSNGKTYTYEKQIYYLTGYCPAADGYYYLFVWTGCAANIEFDELIELVASKNLTPYESL